MNKRLNLAGLLAVALSVNTVPALADDDLSGTDMGPTTRTTGPTGTPETTGEGGSASREGMATAPNYATGVTAEAFIEQASEKNHAILSTAESALDPENGVADNQAIQAYAQKMTETHGELNRKLSELAEREQVEVADSATLMDQAQAAVLEVREDESFLEAYANNQVADHQELLDLFKRAAASDHGELSRFAKETLPSLEEHLQQARRLHPEAREENPQETDGQGQY